MIWLKNYLNIDWLQAVRLTSFNITSILTGTGYTSANYNNWGGFGIDYYSNDYVYWWLCWINNWEE